MKKKTFKNLKVGDCVTMNLWSETLAHGTALNYHDVCKNIIQRVKSDHSDEYSEALPIYDRVGGHRAYVGYVAGDVACIHSVCRKEPIYVYHWELREEVIMHEKEDF